MFITPPGLWHSHNNEGDTYAYVLPIQDAGLLLYQRILGIVLTK
jgi:gentisate 1,2-dioxygenase